MTEVVISGAARTPMGGFQGAFAGVGAPVLGGRAIAAALEGAGVKTVRSLAQIGDGLKEVTGWS